MKKLSSLYGKLRKDKSASTEAFGCEKSYHRRWDSEKELKQFRRRKEDERESPILLKKSGCMSEQLKRAAFSESSGFNPPIPMTPPSGVFIGAEERIPTLRNTPWKTNTLFSDSDDDDDDDVFTPRSSRKKKTISLNRPQHATVERLKRGDERPNMKRTLSVPEEFSPNS